MTTGLFRFASEALSSLKETVISPFAGPAPVQPATTRRPPRPPSLKSLAQSKKYKRRAQAKRLAKKSPRRSATEQEENEEPSAEEPEEEQEQEEQEEQEDEDEVTVVEPPPLTPEEQAQLEARQRKLEKKRAKDEERRRIKQERLDKSIVKELPADPLEDERQQVIDDIRTRLMGIEKLDNKLYEELLDLYPQVQTELENLAVEVDKKSTEMNKKTPRLTVPDDVTCETMRVDIQKYEISNTCDSIILHRRVEELTNLVSQENNKEFQKIMNSFRDMIEDRKTANTRLMDIAREKDTQQRMAARVDQLMRGTFGDESDPANDVPRILPSQIVKNIVELSSDCVSVVFQPLMQVRKVERKFCTAIEQEPRVGGRQSRTVSVWGLAENVNECVEWLKHSDFSGRQKKTFDKRDMGAIIGRGGSRLVTLEAQHKVIIFCAANEVTVYGPIAAAEEIWNSIAVQRQEAQAETRGAKTIYVDSIVARALFAIHRSVIRTIEAEFDVRITVLGRPNEGEPRIMIRGRPEKTEEVEKKLREELIDALSSLTFVAPVWAINRLLLPPRNPSQNATGRMLNEEYKVVRETYGLFVDRKERDEQSETSELYVVCNKSQEDTVKEKIQDLLAKAAYVQDRIPIDREQLRIFTPENRALIEASSQCRFGVQPGQQTYLILTGSEEAIDTGKRVVAEILEREGKVQTYEFKEPDLIGRLLSNRGADIRGLEHETGTSITVNRNDNTAKIVGDMASIDLVVEKLDEKTKEIEDERKDSETLIIDIDSDQVPQVIGRSGANIRELRTIPGIRAIDVPQRSEQQSAVTSIKIVGSKAGVAAVQSRLEQLLRIRREQPTESPAPRGRGRGRGRAPRESSDQRLPPPAAQTISSLAADEDEFPALEYSFDRR